VLERDGEFALRRSAALARVMRCAALVCEATQGAGLPTPKPLAHSLDGGGELAGTRLDAELSGIAHHLKAQVRWVFTLM
jgi:hypothetical protein